MGGLGVVVGMVAAVAVWGRARGRGEPLGRAVGCVLAGGVVVVVLVVVWGAFAVHTDWELGLGAP